MKLLNSLVVSSMLLSLAACNSQQDPLAGAPDSVRNGIPADQNLPPSSKPISKEALQIDAPNLVNGKVDNVIEIKIAGRVLIPQVDFNLGIENMDQFPGATFDTKSGTFKWKPNRDALNNGADTQYELVVKLTTVPGASGYPISIERKNIAINVFRTFVKPIVTSVTASRTYTVGNSYTLDMEFMDTDAATSDDFSLVFKDCPNTTPTVAPNLTYENADFLKNPLTGKFKGKLTLNLKNRNMPYDVKDYCVQVISFSKFGVPSDAYQVNMTIKNPLSAVKVTQDEIIVRQGTFSDVNISFYDPQQIGELTVRSMTDIAKDIPGSKVACDNVRYSPVIDCKFSLDATTAALGSYKVDFVLQNAKWPQDTVETKHSIVVKVKGLL